MKESVRQRARALGFDDCRVTTANAPESAARFTQWLAERRHGEMAYLERNAPKRVDPQQVLPGARSLITLAVSYAWEGREAARSPSEIARAPNPQPQPATPPLQASSLAMRVTATTTTSWASGSSSSRTW